MLKETIFRYLCEHGNRCYTNDENLREENKYFIVILGMDKNGEFKDNISVLSVQGTTNTANVIESVKQTQGHWINHTRKNRTVIFPIYFVFSRSDNQKILEKDPVLIHYFSAVNADNMVCLEPFVITLGQGVR